MKCLVLKTKMIFQHPPQQHCRDCFPKPGLCVPTRGEFPAVLLPSLVDQSWSPGIIKVGKNQGASCPCSPLLLEQWISLCNPCLPSAAQGGEQDNPKAPCPCCTNPVFGAGLVRLFSPVLSCPLLCMAMD